MALPCNYGPIYRGRITSFDAFLKFGITAIFATTMRFTAGINAVLVMPQAS